MNATPSMVEPIAADKITATMPVSAEGRTGCSRCR
jgi:hypothetical protein